MLLFYCWLFLFFLFNSLPATLHLLFLLCNHPPSPHLSACSSLTPPSNFSQSFSMRYSCDPPAVRRLALAWLKSRSVLLLARGVQLPHSQFTRLPWPLRAQGANQGEGGGSTSSKVCRGGGLRVASELRQGSVGHRMLHKVPGCWCTWLKLPSCLAWGVQVEVMRRCGASTT